ncbi:hypothetical protein LY76DRAFT_325967 [Colletotrichum caudatum]|nr:hypothetical protein LY76DRAFT_325967 [Colletotrichum caudatum]
MSASIGARGDQGPVLAADFCLFLCFPAVISSVYWSGLSDIFIIRTCRPRQADKYRAEGLLAADPLDKETLSETISSLTDAKTNAKTDVIEAIELLKL